MMLCTFCKEKLQASFFSSSVGAIAACSSTGSSVVLLPQQAAMNCEMIRLLCSLTIRCRMYSRQARAKLRTMVHEILLVKRLLFITGMLRSPSVRTQEENSSFLFKSAICGTAKLAFPRSRVQGRR